jgi:large subunit ribosomal protein L22
MENTIKAKASVSNVGVTPRKVRLVIDLVRGKSVAEAQAILKNVNKAASPIVLKLVNSAAANAVNNYGMSQDKLYVEEIYADEGVKMKRFMPRAKGRASGLVKKTSHINVVVAER